MARRMTIDERDETKRVADMVLSQAAACATADETRDLSLNFIHGGAAALVATAGFEYTTSFLRTLADIIGKQAEDERRAQMN